MLLMQKRKLIILYLVQRTQAEKTYNHIVELETALQLFSCTHQHTVLAFILVKSPLATEVRNTKAIFAKATFPDYGLAITRKITVR